MKYQAILKWLIPLIAVLALFAALMGLFDQTPGEPYAFTNHRGESVTINGHGLYFYDTVSAAAQEQGNDIVTLFVRSVETEYLFSLLRITSPAPKISNHLRWL